VSASGVIHRSRPRPVAGRRRPQAGLSGSQRRCLRSRPDRPAPGHHRAPGLHRAPGFAGLGCPGMVTLCEHTHPGWRSRALPRSGVFHPRAASNVTATTSQGLHMAEIWPKMWRPPQSTAFRGVVCATIPQRGVSQTLPVRYCSVIAAGMGNHQARRIRWWPRIPSKSGTSRRLDRSRNRIYLPCIQGIA
jgi:hypothetical protein